MRECHDLAVEEGGLHLDIHRGIVAPSVVAQVAHPLHSDGRLQHVQEGVVVVVETEGPLGGSDGQGAAEHEGGICGRVARDANGGPVGSELRRVAGVAAAELREACEAAFHRFGAMAQPQRRPALPELHLPEQLVEAVHEACVRCVRVRPELRHQPAADPLPHVIDGAHIAQHEVGTARPIGHDVWHVDALDRVQDPSPQAVDSAYVALHPCEHGECDPNQDSEGQRGAMDLAVALVSEKVAKLPSRHPAVHVVDAQPLVPHAMHDAGHAGLGESRGRHGCILNVVIVPVMLAKEDPHLQIRASGSTGLPQAKVAIKPMPVEFGAQQGKRAERLVPFAEVLVEDLEDEIITRLPILHDLLVVPDRVQRIVNGSSPYLEVVLANDPAYRVGVRLVRA
mmetsp:Transcript_108069/g.312272  ORF Transcript_108069/g.312272 Transcript_108069/m.312272 type:complete len:396 (+) Transcript_108069:1752-2939(+)